MYLINPRTSGNSSENEVLGRIEPIRTVPLIGLRLGDGTGGGSLAYGQSEGNKNNQAQQNRKHRNQRE